MEDILDYLAEEATKIIARSQQRDLTARVNASRSCRGIKFYSVALISENGRICATGASSSARVSLISAAQQLGISYPFATEYLSAEQRCKLLNLADHDSISRAEKTSVILAINRFTPAEAETTIQAMKDTIRAYELAMHCDTPTYVVTGEAYQVAQM